MQTEKDFKIIRITSITLLVVLLALILFFFIGTYISAKYIDQEVWPGDLFVDEVKVQENCMQLKGNLYPTMNFYQAMKYEIQNDCMYITLYKSMISRRRGDTCSVNIVISDERLENVKYIYAVGRGKEKLIYAQ